MSIRSLAHRANQGSTSRPAAIRESIGPLLFCSSVATDECRVCCYSCSWVPRILLTDGSGILKTAEQTMTATLVWRFLLCNRSENGYTTDYIPGHVGTHPGRVWFASLNRAPPPSNSPVSAKAPS